MMLVIPAIELRNGQSVQLVKGEQGTEKLYMGMSQNPLELSKLWRRENAKTIHINDLDASERHTNQLNINAILYISQSVDIPIQLFSFFRNVDECRFFLQNGVYRVILDELAFVDPDGVRQLIREFTPYRIIFNANTSNGNINFNQLTHVIDLWNYVSLVKDLGGSRIVYGEDKWKKTTDGPDHELLVKLARETKLKVTINGGISNATQLLGLRELSGTGVDSVIIGDALYLNCFPCQKIWRLVEAELEPMLKYNC